MARILSAYDSYRSLNPGGNVQSLETAIAVWRAKHKEKEYSDPLHQDATPVQALVNHGRWMILCACNNGVVIPPPEEADHKAICPSCGTIWTNVVFPNEVAEIEQVLEERPFRPNQNWMPGETVDKLKQENAANAAAKGRP